MMSLFVGRKFHERGGERVESFPHGDAEHQAIEIFHRQWTKQETVDRAENGGVRANADGERNDRDGGVTGRLQQNPRAVAEILPKRLHFSRPSLGGNSIFNNTTVK